MKVTPAYAMDWTCYIYFTGRMPAKGVLGIIEMIEKKSSKAKLGDGMIKCGSKGLFFNIIVDSHTLEWLRANSDFTIINCDTDDIF
ncbi:MAG: hypothetical protein ABIE68_02085 [bacterium]